MEDGSDAQHVRVFWDTAHGNELALHDLRSSLSKCEAIQGRDARRLVLENTRDQINDFFFLFTKKTWGRNLGLIFLQHPSPHCLSPLHPKLYSDSEKTLNLWIIIQNTLAQP